MFAENGNKILTYFKWKTAFFLIVKNAKKYFLTLLVLFLLEVLVLIVKLLPIVLLKLASVNMFVIMAILIIITVTAETYLLFVNSYLFPFIFRFCIVCIFFADTGLSPKYN